MEKSPTDPAGKTAGGQNQRMTLHFTPTNGPADDAIAAIIEMVGGIRRPDIVRELILAALKAGQEDDEKADLKLMNTTLKEMRFTAKVFGPYRHIRKVSVFGSARTPQDAPSYAMAQELGRLLAARGYMVITGGGPGIMQAVNEGAGPEHSFGINIRLPFEQKPNPIVDGNPRSINYKYFFNRKVAFLKEADAVVLFPGGFGTMDEAMETLTLAQTGKHNPLPVIMLEPPGQTYWRNWADFVERDLAGNGHIDREDLGLFEITDSVAQAVARIEKFYRRYHSLRFVADRLVIRLCSALPSDAFERLPVDFGDLLRPGGAFTRLASALPEEADEPAIAALPRLVVDFNRTRFARLKALIDFINRA
ncbi:MAG: TIGR00730 family Rossman fold protein [Desulfobacterales bacterium]|nr:TIGR00730 family Rossman fold protein [Desulfobacterales bacterium]MDJ0888139.1 TIGR00730 family Rossman fold protein [Desulfobacterales bacterium]